MPQHLRNLHRHAQQEDSIAVLQGRGIFDLIQANPFKYRHIHYLKKNTRIYSEENNPMVVMCTPGMLQNGQSRTLLERWCHDPKNGVCITGYCAEGSIASNLKKGDCIPSM
jgi:cleavage and polyadenylation specificity factor subunit 3